MRPAASVAQTRGAGLAVASPGAPLVTVKTTAVSGWAERVTETATVSPASVTARSVTGLTVIPAVPLSVFVTETSAAFRLW